MQIDPASLQTRAGPFNAVGQRESICTVFLLRFLTKRQSQLPDDQLEKRMRVKQPLLMRVEFAYPLEHANDVIGQIVQPMKRQMWKCSHGKYSISFVVVTEETSLELVKRLGLNDNEAITDYTCHVAPIGVICKHGGFNTLHTAVTKAWEAVGQRRNPEYVRQTKRFDPRIERRVEDRESGAIRQVRVEPPRVRKPSQDPYRPKR